MSLLGSGERVCEKARTKDSSLSTSAAPTSAHISVPSGVQNRVREGVALTNFVKAAATVAVFVLVGVALMVGAVVIAPAVMVYVVWSQLRILDSWSLWPRQSYAAPAGLAPTVVVPAVLPARPMAPQWSCPVHGTSSIKLSEAGRWYTGCTVCDLERP